MTTARRYLALLTALFLLPLLAVTTATSTASTASAAGGTDAAGLFTPLPAFSPSALSDASVRPAQFKAYQADLAGLRAQLAGGRTTLTIPDPAGTPTAFNVVEDSVMEPELQAAHPDIRTYAGAAANGTSIRLDVGPLGFHAMVRRPDGVVWYVEPATGKVGETRVLSFARAAAGERQTFVEKQVQQATQDAAALAASDESFSTPGGAVTQRNFRLALVTDPNYAAFVAPGLNTHATSDPVVLNAKVALINRVNEPYNDDVAYKFLLIADTESKLNLLTAAEMSGTNGPCGANACFPAATGSYDCGDVLDRNAFVLGQLVGADNFDLGHIGLGVNGGGVAGLGVVGGASKARGCTGIPTPVGDVYAIDYVAHEMGHQMGGSHTFNGTQSNCSGGNRSGANSVEPGSGVTIQAYAGICASDNLQPHSDPYFSFRSVDQFEATTAAARSPLSERQSVATTGLAAGEQLTISCASGCTPTNVVFDNNASDAGDIAAAIQTATATTGVTVTNYDGGGGPSTSGFTATWGDTVDHPTLTVTGPFTALVGTLVQGGPQGNGGTTALTANNSPVVTAPADKTIPTRTPFTLTGSATDSNADVLTYQWEQTDTGLATGTGLVDNNKLNGPLFRVFGVSAQVSASDTILYHSPGENLAGTDPSRTFPDLAQILAGNTNAATGTCPAPLAAGTVPITDPALNCFSEFLPTSSWLGTGDRVMHFRLTARDEFTPDGPADDPGGVSWDNLALTVDPTAGPFLVTSRSTAGTAAGSETVTWAVAGTDAPALAPTVNILLSSDGGLTYPTTLAAGTANDGSETVVLPNSTIASARIKVEAVGNYFFDVNDATFSITPAGPPPPAASASTVKASAKPKQVVKGHGFKVKAAVSTAGGVPAGTVQVFAGKKLLGTGTLKNGKVTIKVKPKKAKKLKVGKNTLTAKYLGSTTVAASQATFKIKVKQP